MHRGISWLANSKDILILLPTVSHLTLFMGGYLVTDVITAGVHYSYWSCVKEPQDTDAIWNRLWGLSKVDEVLGQGTVTGVKLPHDDIWGNTVYNEYVDFRSHCLIIPSAFITPFIHSPANVFSFYGAYLSGAMILHSLIPQGIDFLHALCKYIYCPFSSAFPSILVLHNPTAVYKRER